MNLHLQRDVTYSNLDVGSLLIFYQPYKILHSQIDILPQSQSLQTNLLPEASPIKVLHQRCKLYLERHQFLHEQMPKHFHILVVFDQLHLNLFHWLINYSSIWILFICPLVHQQVHYRELKGIFLMKIFLSTWI